MLVERILPGAHGEDVDPPGVGHRQVFGHTEPVTLGGADRGDRLRPRHADVMAAGLSDVGGLPQYRALAANNHHIAGRPLQRRIFCVTCPGRPPG